MTIFSSLDLSNTNDKHFVDVNQSFNLLVSYEHSRIQQFTASLMSHMKRIQRTRSLKPEMLEGLLNRYEIVQKKLLVRLNSLRTLLSVSNQYGLKSNLGESLETVSTHHL